MRKKYAERLPENWRLTTAIKQAHELLRTVVVRQDRIKKNATPGRAVPPVAPSKRPVTLPKVSCLDGENDADR